MMEKTDFKRVLKRRKELDGLYDRVMVEWIVWHEQAKRERE